MEPDPDRVAATIFLPGQELAAAGASRSTAVMDRILRLSDEQVADEVAALRTAFAGRHRDLDRVWFDHFRLVEHRLIDHPDLTDDRRRLLGATFTQEFAIESVALFNPSMVVHPDQSGLSPGATRFVMAVRGVGEGHISSIELRTGVVDRTGSVAMDPPPEVVVLPRAVASTWVRASFEQQLIDLGGDRTNSDFVLESLPEEFTREDLDVALQSLRDQRLTRGASVRTLDRFDLLAASSYSVEFPEDSEISERVLMPRSPAERHGMEDLRLVRLPLEEGGHEYVGTYTAYDGTRIGSHLLRTTDFRRFTVRRLSGPGARDKGLALFPRTIRGRYVALSRTDRESNGISTSHDMLHWTRPEIVARPERPWEAVQLGNCGSPIETPHGWLVLTHGVGPMRTYSIGAMLLDLETPTRVLGRLREPLLVPDADERSGYVPNVVYSCGAMQHGPDLVLPYGCSDTSSRIALVGLDPLIAELLQSSDVAPAASSQIPENA
ncbi:MAG TPA: glycoside hydrolase family 130 protein [Candidatus Nanopelagicales bacterium]|nr:glycoside hydrolase family 130 protein [Candidatus Nanopelagicales bacterium]